MHVTHTDMLSALLVRKEIMKKNLLWIVFILMALGVIVAASYKPVMREIKSKPVEKTISFLLYKGSNYNSKVYKGSSAQVHISVEKVRNTTRTIVWDTTFDAKLLNKYPSLKKALSQKVTIQNVIESKDHLEINYLLTYESNGSVLKMQSTNFNSPGMDTLVIRL